MRVKVKFLPEVARWIRETDYHETQVVTELPDGGIIFEATVNGIREIGRWLMGYGANAEVLEPASLRAIIAAESKKMLVLYEKD